MKRSIVVLAALAGLAVCAPLANAADATTSSTTTAASTSASASSSTPAASSTTDSSSSSSSKPTTTTPATETPSTTVTETPITTTTTTPTVTTTPGTTTTVPCAADCIPESTPVECTTADCIPSSSGGVPIGSGNAVATLPFTGIGDVLAPALLALVVVLGGVVAWRWAQLREAVAAAASNRRDQVRYGAPIRTGYEGAMRQLGIEDRARRVFTPRVA